MDNEPQLQDLRLFCEVARRSSFVAAARSGRASTTWVSKRVAMLERALGVKLLNRTTRSVSLTQEGLKVLEWAGRILGEVEDLRDELSQGTGVLRGPLRICTSARLGRQIVAPVLSRLAQRYPGLDVWLELMDRRVDLVGEGFHLDIRAGEVDEPTLIAHHIAPSARFLCAAPAYLERHGEPRSAADLAAHNCLLLRDRAEPFGTWRLQGPRGADPVKVSGSLASNDIDVVLRWALDGHGIMMSTDWLFAPALASGALVRVLPQWRQRADVNAVSSQRSAQSAKVRLCIEFLKDEMAPLMGGAPRRPEGGASTQVPP